MSSKFVDNLPLILVDRTRQLPLIKVANEILEAKQQNMDTTYLERQIETLVYQLYDLTPDEIAIVENSSIAKNNEIESQLQEGDDTI